MIEPGVKVGDEKLVRPTRRSAAAVHGKCRRPPPRQWRRHTADRGNGGGQTVDADDVGNGDQPRPPVPLQHDKRLPQTELAMIVVGAGMLRMADQVAAAACRPPLQTA